MFESTKKLWASGSLLAAAVLAMPATASEAGLRAEVEQLRAEMAQLRAEQGETWLNERRAEEVKGLIRDVLADADTRSTLLQDGVLAGHDGKFFVASADGNYRLNFTGQFQFRYILNINGSDASNSDGSDASGTVTNSGAGFQLRRMKLGFTGHAIKPELTFKFVLSGSRSSGDAGYEDAWVAYDLDEFLDGLKVKIGNQKLPFLKQELISSSRQTAVDRASVTEFFTLNRQLGVNLEYKTDSWMVNVQTGNGANNGISDFNDAGGDYNIAVRGDFNVFGNDWKDGRDNVAWSGKDTALFLGVAGFYQDGSRTGDSFTFGDEYLAFTADALFKTGPFSILTTFTKGLIHAASEDDETPWGVLAEAGYMVIPDTFQPYLRYEAFDMPSGGVATNHLVTGGFNWFFKKHSLKFTADAVWVVHGEDSNDIDPFGSNPYSDSLGFDGISGDGQVVLRTQLQLLY
ncbi:MAG: porin [Planctomycetota bacterium]